jgi:hypothetical protein
MDAGKESAAGERLMRPKLQFIPIHRDKLELAGRIIPKAKRRDNFGSNSPPLGAYFVCPAACGGAFHSNINYHNKK